MTDQASTPGENQDNSNASDKAAADAAADAAAASGGADPAKAAADKAASDKAAADAAAAQASTTWGEKWREDYATKAATIDGKLNEEQQGKILARLKRFPSAKEALDWAFNADKKIADGSFKKPLGEKATAEEIAEYRKANGIPETPEKYLDNLPAGLVIGDEDKPFIEQFTKAFHGKNADPAIVHTAIQTYYKVVDEQEGLRQEANTAAKTATEDALRAEWGADYRANTNLINAFVGSMPKELQDELFQSSKPDGTQIMNNPEMLKWFAQQARELNYTGAVLPSGEASSKGITTEIDGLKAKMADRNSDYWKGPTADKQQARYRELLELQERIKSRAA